MSNLTEGSYLIKYIVNGQFKCEPHLPTMIDSSGHLNNLLEIVYENTELLTLREGGVGMRS